MRARIYADVVVNPVSFPDDIEIVLYPLRRSNDTPLGGVFTMSEHHSWKWVCDHYSPTKEAAENIAAGNRVKVYGGHVMADFRDDTMFPSEADVVPKQ